MAIDSILIPHFEDSIPPEKVLDVAVIDGHVSMAISEYSETTDSRHLEQKATIIVDLRDLMSSINLLSASWGAAYGDQGVQQASVSGSGGEIGPSDFGDPFS